MFLLDNCNFSQFYSFLVFSLLEKTKVKDMCFSYQNQTFIKKKKIKKYKRHSKKKKKSPKCATLKKMAPIKQDNT